jgi:hypothetical protein
MQENAGQRNLPPLRSDIVVPPHGWVLFRKHDERRCDGVDRTFSGLDLPLQFGGVPEIVIVEERYPIATSRCDTVVAWTRGQSVARTHDESDARIPPGELPDKCLRSVGRTVIAYQALPLAVCLRRNGFECTAKKRETVVRADDDADEHETTV